MVCIMFMTSKSAAICSRRLWYCSFTATVICAFEPFGRTCALCTCASAAAAIGICSTDSTRSMRGFLSSSSSTGATSAPGRGVHAHSLDADGRPAAVYSAPQLVQV